MKRVLYRLGISGAETEEAALDAARKMNPDYPGELAGGLWWIGRNWCYASHPDFHNCQLNTFCLKRK